MKGAGRLRGYSGEMTGANAITMTGKTAYTVDILHEVEWSDQSLPYISCFSLQLEYLITVDHVNECPSILSNETLLLPSKLLAVKILIASPN